MGLQEYHRKRDFDVTGEPKGEEHDSGPVLAFVIQKHAASHLHYDFRLELDGVLLSWAVPKGPSLDPSVKRLAVHVEDHPVEYGDFEGVIPRGEYGGGTVMLWDRGAWVPDGDPRKAYRKGDLKFRLEGEKLRGAWHLVRSRRAGDDGGKEQWLLFKGSDEHARAESEEVVTETEPRSVKTGRTMEEIAAQADDVWHSNRPPKGAKTAREQLAAVARAAREKAAAAEKDTDKPAGKQTAKTSKTKTTSDAVAPSPADLPGARKARLPAELLPQLATLEDEVPPGKEWLHEIKFDGYRFVVTLEKGRARMLTRKANDWTSRFPGFAQRFAGLPARSAVLDGELVIMGPGGVTSFQLLQNVLNNGREDELVFYAFDLLHLDGYDLRGVPLLQRKETLRALLAGLAANGPIRFSDHVVGNGKAFLQQGCRMGLEGIISKRADSHYTSKRTRDWLKVKCQRRQEFVVGGYTEPKGSRTGFGALLVGVYEGDRLVHSGKVGTGFDDATLRELLKRMRPLETEKSPFADFGQRRTPAGVHWLRPELVCEVAFTEFTEEGILRHPTFQGIREDKPPREVVREEPGGAPSPAPRAKAKAAADEALADGGSAPPTRGRSARAAPPPSTQSRRVRGRGGAGDAEVAGVRISSPDKLLYPELGITKLDLARYYEAIGEWMLPHVGERPLTLVRCPDGVAGQCFYQKHGDQHFVEQIGRVQIAENDGDVKTYTYVDNVAALVGMVQMGVLELHTSNARIDDFEKPDRFIIDLDPAPDVPWARTVAAAFQVRDRLEELGLKSWVKTTGGKGLHVAVPLARKHTWDEVKEFSKQLSADLSARSPGQYITKSTLSKRKGKIFLDYLRNGRGATAISAYCARAKPTAAASVPITWEELTPSLRTDDFTPDAVIARLKRMKVDPWKGFYRSRQTLTKKAKEGVGMK
ncbi:MAG TPA: DNA ligase D [Longimicrobium sp.]|nr:DNA ligase D [Longimicrobium sp.]